MIQAWVMTTEHRKNLFWFGFIPSFFSILMTGWYVFYQAQGFWNSSFFQGAESDFFFSFLGSIWSTLSSNGIILTISILSFLCMLLGWFFSPMISRAAITHLISQLRDGKPPEKGFSTAFFRFFPLFEMAALRRGLEPISFFTEFSFVARNIPSILPIVIPVLLFLGTAGVIALFFLAYSTQTIMLRHKNFLGGITLSFRTVIENFGRTFRILLLFFLVELRVLINVLIVLFFPLILMGVVGFFTKIFSHSVGLFAGGFLLFCFVLIAAYLTGILFIFSEAILTLAFLEYTEDIENKGESQKREG